MYFDMHIPLGSYRNYDEMVQAHDRVYSDDPEIVQFGCEQIFAWLSKSAKNQPFFEITALIASNIAKNSKSPLGENSFRHFLQSMKYLINRIIAEFPSDYEHYQYLSQCAFSDERYSPTREEFFSFSNNLLIYLDENFWIPNIKIHQKIVEDSIKHISEYFDSEGPFNISKTNFLLYFVPLLAKEFCKDFKSENIDDEELIFGFSRSELMEKFPNFINNAIDFTDQKFIDSFAFEFADYFIQGSTWASKVLDMLLENKLCDLNLISSYILNAPKKDQKIIDFIKKHGIQVNQQDSNFWYGIPMGFIPYQYNEYSIDTNSELEIDRSLVGILHEERKNYNARKNTQNRYTNNNRNTNSKTPAPASSINSTKMYQQPQNTQNDSSRSKNNEPIDFKPSHLPNSSKTHTVQIPNNAQNNNNSMNSNSNKPHADHPNTNTQHNSNGNTSHITITERSKDKKLEITKPQKKK